MAQRIGPRSAILAVLLLAASACSSGSSSAVSVAPGPTSTAGPTTTAVPSVSVSSTVPVLAEPDLEPVDERVPPCAARPDPQARPGEFQLDPAFIADGPSLVPGAVAVDRRIGNVVTSDGARTNLLVESGWAFANEGVPSVFGLFTLDGDEARPLVVADGCVLESITAVQSGDWVIAGAANPMGLISYNLATGELRAVSTVGVALTVVHETRPAGVWLVDSNDARVIQRFDAAAQALAPPLDIDGVPAARMDFASLLDTRHGLVVSGSARMVLVDPASGETRAEAAQAANLLGGDDDSIWMWTYDAPVITQVETAALTELRRFEIADLRWAAYGDGTVWYVTVAEDFSATIGTIDIATGEITEQVAFQSVELEGRGGPYQYVPRLRPVDGGVRFYDESVNGEFELTFDE